MGDKTLGRRTHHPTKGNKKGHNGRQRDTRPSGGHTIQQRETRRKAMGDQGRQDPREGGHTIQQRETMGDYGRQDLGKRRTHHPTTRNKKGYNGRQAETRPSGRRTHHPTKGNKKEYNGRQGETSLGKTDIPSYKGKQEGVQWEKSGDKTLGKADTPSNTKADTLRKHSEYLTGPNSTLFGGKNAQVAIPSAEMLHLDVRLLLQSNL